MLSVDDGSSVDALVDLARRAAQLARAGDVSALVALRADLLERASCASGASLDRLEIALAFFARFVPEGLSRESLALHRLLGGPSDAARTLLVEAAEGRGVDIGRVQRADAETIALLDALIAAGVLVRSRQILRVAPAWIDRVRAHVEPSPLQTWRAVETGRRLAAEKRAIADRAIVFAGVVGVTVAQATIFLEHVDVADGSRDAP